MKRSKASKGEVVTGSLTVGEVEHSVKLTSKQDSLLVQVQNMRSGESWQNSFPSSLLEKITSKTGNYKHFAVFVEMLSAAVTRSSDSVEVELLTYADLVTLKTGKKQSKALNADTKKYLILTYTVQFDTVHYPLPLPYAGRIGTAELQTTVDKLQCEIDELKTQIVSPQPHSACCKDNAALKEEIIILKQREKAFNSADTSAKDSIELTKALKHLEQDMIREKNKYQKALDRKGGEVRKLVDEVESLRATNRTLTVRLRSMGTELSVAKGSRSLSRGRGYLNSSSNHSSPASRNHSASRSNHSASRSNTKSRPRSAPITPGSAQSARSTASSTARSAARSTTRNTSRERGRSDSRESVGVFSRKRASSRGSSSGPSEVRTRARTPSPAGARFPRFDPSAYIKDKQAKLNEAKSSRDRQSASRTHLPRARSTPLSNRQSPSTSIYHRPPPSSVVQDIIKGNLLNGRTRRSNSVSSVDSQFSYTSNRSNGSKQSNRSNGSRQSKQSNRSNTSRPKKQKAKYSYPTSGSELSDKENSRTSNSHGNHGNRDSNYLNTRTPAVDLTLDQSNVSFTKDSEIAEIDARLNALQTYLRDAKNKQYTS